MSWEDSALDLSLRIHLWILLNAIWPPGDHRASSQGILLGTGFEGHLGLDCKGLYGFLVTEYEPSGWNEGTFPLFCVNKGNHYSLLTTNPVIHHYIEKPLDKIGVFLDCEAGYLSFLNIAKSSLIYRYPHKTFKYRVWPFFSYGQTIP